MPTSNSRILFLLILLVALIPTTSTLLPSIPKAHAVTVTFTLFAYASGGWNATTPPANPTITVTEGDMVTIVLKPGDGFSHRWFLDVDKNGSVPDCPGPDICSQVFSTLSPPPVTFTAPSAGTYTYYCSLHPTLMFGQFVVQPATVGGGLVPTNNLSLLLTLGLASLAASLIAVMALRRISHGRTSLENAGRVS